MTTTFETFSELWRPAVLDAPSNLGLSPPAEGVVPGCYKLAGALRNWGGALDLTDTLVAGLAPALTARREE
jgi:hypothetical protein